MEDAMEDIRKDMKAVNWWTKEKSIDKARELAGRLLPVGYCKDKGATERCGFPCYFSVDEEPERQSYLIVHPDYVWLQWPMHNDVYIFAGPKQVLWLSDNEMPEELKVALGDCEVTKGDPWETDFYLQQRITAAQVVATDVPERYEVFLKMSGSNTPLLKPKDESSWERILMADGSEYYAEDLVGDLELHVSEW